MFLIHVRQTYSDSQFVSETYQSHKCILLFHEWMRGRESPSSYDLTKTFTYILFLKTH